MGTRAGAAYRAEHRERVMARAGTGHSPRSEVEHQALHGDEHAAGILLGELVVQPPQYLVGFSDLARERAEHGDRHGHEERGRNALSRHVAQRHDDAIVGRAEHFVEIAANLTCRLDDCMHVEAGAPGRDGEVCGQDAHLDLAGDAEVACHRLADGVGVPAPP